MQKYVKLLFFLLPFCLFGQDRSIDSLKLVLKGAKHDTTRCRILYQLAETAPEGEWENYNEKLLYIAELNLSKNSDKKFKRLYLKYLSSTLHNFGLLSLQQGNSSKALIFYEKALKTNEELEDTIGIANSFSGIAMVYGTQGNTNKCLEYNVKSLKLSEAFHYDNGMIVSLITIGHVYESQDDYVNALNNYQKASKIAEKTNNALAIASILSNIGSIHQKNKKAAIALSYFQKSLILSKKAKSIPGIANALKQIGKIHEDNGSDLMAFENYNQCLKLFEEMQDKNSVSEILFIMAGQFYKTKKYSKAIEYGTKSLTIAKTIGYADNIKQAAFVLKNTYKELNQPKQSLEMYELYIQMRDSISNQETRKASIKSQLKYEYEKKAAADSVKVAEEKKLTTLKLKQEQTQRYYLYCGLGLTALFGLFMFTRFRVTQKQKSVIEEQKLIVEKQKHIVDEKQKEILDSIRYAKRIQQSLLPTEKFISRILKK